MCRVEVKTLFPILVLGSITAHGSISPSLTPSLSPRFTSCQCFGRVSPRLSRQTDRVVKMSGPLVGRSPTPLTHRSSDTDSVARWTREEKHITACTLVARQLERIHQYFFSSPIIHWSGGIIACDYDSCCTGLGITRCIHG